MQVKKLVQRTRSFKAKIFSGGPKFSKNWSLQGTKNFSEKIRPGTKIFRTKIPVTYTHRSIYYLSKSIAAFLSGVSCSFTAFLAQGVIVKAALSDNASSLKVTQFMSTEVGKSVRSLIIPAAWCLLG